MKDNAPGIGLVFGSALGALVYALTGQYLWIGVGAALGLVIGAAVVSGRARGRKDDPPGR